MHTLVCDLTFLTFSPLTTYGVEGRAVLDWEEEANSVDEWLQLAQRYRGDARLLLKNGRASGAWQSIGFSVEFVVKAAVMKRAGYNRWPPELRIHDLDRLMGELGVDVRGMVGHPVGPKLKVVLGWRRRHGYTGSMPERFAQQIWDAAYGDDGVVEWLATNYALNI